MTLSFVILVSRGGFFKSKKLFCSLILLLRLFPLDLTLDEVGLTLEYILEDEDGLVKLVSLV